MKTHVLVAALLFVALGGTAQVGEKITVNVVEVPVTVVDRDGNPVRGLTAANFSVFDDGNRRPLAGVEEVDFSARREESAIAPINPAARRSFMLLFDVGFSTPATLARAQEAARRFVLETVKPRDLVAVGSISPEQGFRLLTAFTTDRELIAAALAEPLSFRGSDPLQLTAAEPGQMPGGDLRPISHPFSVREEAKGQSRTSPRPADAFAGTRIAKEIDNLAALASMLRAVPGRKQIILLSEGFDPEYVRGGDARGLGRGIELDPDTRYGNSGSMKLIREMAKTFRASDAVLHAIDIRGVRMQNDVSGARISSDDALFLLARPTGGEVFHNSNDLGREFSTMLAHQDVVYVVAFHAPASKSGRLHGLEVRVAGVPGARASYRSGYYESGPETPLQRTLSNAEIIINDIPQSDVRVSTVSAAFPNAGERAQVPIIVEIDGASLLKKAAAELYIYAFDQEGLVRDRLYQKISFDLTKVGARLRDGGVKYYGTLSLPPGRYAVKTLVRVGDNERRGFARTDVTVPRRGEMAMASFFIDERPGDWIMVKGTSHDPAAAYPFSISGEAFVPSATARPRGGGMRKLAVIVYNARPDDLTLQTTAASRVLRKVAAGEATQLVIELDAPAEQAAVDVSVQKKDAAAAMASAHLTLQ